MINDSNLPNRVSNAPSSSGPAGGAPDWEAAYQSAVTPWDKGRAHPALLRWLGSHAMVGRILVPGCGSGHDVRALSTNPLAEVVGLDLAPSSALAAAKHPRTGGERYLTGNFLEGNSPEGAFDWIFEHTCFCAINPACRPAYAKAAATALRPGGCLLAVFYRNPSHGGDDGPPYGCSMPEIDRLFGPWFEAVSEEENIETFEGREGREVLRCMRRNSVPCQFLTDAPQAGQNLDIPSAEL